MAFLADEMIRESLQDAAGPEFWWLKHRRHQYRKSYRHRAWPLPSGPRQVSPGANPALPAAM